jgi:hypothetical protein
MESVRAKLRNSLELSGLAREVGRAQVGRLIDGKWKWPLAIFSLVSLAAQAMKEEELLDDRDAA